MLLNQSIINIIVDILLAIINSLIYDGVMGTERLEFGWYLRKISWLALLGYLAGAATYLGLMAALGR